MSLDELRWPWDRARNQRDIAAPPPAKRRSASRYQFVFRQKRSQWTIEDYELLPPAVHGAFRLRVHTGRMMNANHQPMSLSKADLSNKDLRGANLSGALLYKTNLNKTDLRGANLSNAVLLEADLSEANLSEADLRGAILSNADLREASLFDANLFDADLRGAILRGANLSNANMLGANLSGADLQDANLSEADLRGANLTNASLRAANLARLRLAYADLTNALYAPAAEPPDPYVAGIQGLSTVRVPSGYETGIMQLRKLLLDAGLWNLEREATYSIRKRRT